tara:strand:+ start:1281 stop:2102 length:822 start_codon:yes stop_codon:yes gene_type:complete
MFTYIDPKVRRRLLERGKLVTINADGEVIDSDADPINATQSISILGPIPLPISSDTKKYNVSWYACVRRTELNKVEQLADKLRDSDGKNSFAILASSMAVNSVLVLGDPDRWINPLVRVHSSCLTGDVFGSGRCECGPQLDMSLESIAKEEKGGMVVYMSGHEGRGIGLWAKAATYLLQDDGEDTYQANRSLGLDDDSRDFSDAAILIKYFYGIKEFRLLTNNPKKIDDLYAYGLEDITPVKHIIGVTDDNRDYLLAKRDWGHRLDEQDLSKK